MCGSAVLFSGCWRHYQALLTLPSFPWSSPQPNHSPISAPSEAVSSLTHEAVACATTALPSLSPLLQLHPPGACSPKPKETLAHMSVRCPPVCKKTLKGEELAARGITSGLWQVLRELHAETREKIIWAKVTLFHWHQTEKHITADLSAQFYIPVCERIWCKSQDHHSVLKKWLVISSPSSCWQREFESCFIF